MQLLAIHRYTYMSDVECDKTAVWDSKVSDKKMKLKTI